MQQLEEFGPEQEAEGLERRLQERFNELGVNKENQDSVYSLLNPLKKKDIATYNHSIRVGLLGSQIARHMHLDEKALLFPGCLHDIGKEMVDPDLLKKTEGFDKKDMQKMKKHPEYSYMILKGIHDFSAEVALRHHIWQEKGYPGRFPKYGRTYSTNTRLMINFFARLLSLADFYDSASSRINDKFGEKRKLSPEEVKNMILVSNPDQKGLIEDLYVNGIFGEDMESPATHIQKSLYESLWNGWEGKRTPREVRRFVTLACALEPLSEKTGCTTRETDASQHLKLEYFIAGAVNIGDAFEDLASRIDKYGKQPELIYDLALKAQSDCCRNRGGGRINQGIIEMLVPIVTAQMIFDRDYQTPAGEVLEKARQVLQNTSAKDVEELIKMKRLAYDLCAYHEREVPVYNVKTVYDYYKEDLTNSKNQTSIKHNQEFVSGFPVIREVYGLIMSSNAKKLERKVENAYSTIRNKDHKDTGVGLTADCIACGIYLVLSNNPKDKVII